MRKLYREHNSRFDLVAFCGLAVCGAGIVFIIINLINL